MIKKRESKLTAFRQSKMGGISKHNFDDIGFLKNVK